MPGDKVFIDGKGLNPKEARAALETFRDEEEYPDQIIIRCQDNLTYYFKKGIEYKVGVIGANKKSIEKLPDTISIDTVIRRIDKMCFHEKNTPLFTIEDNNDYENDFEQNTRTPSPKLARAAFLRQLKGLRMRSQSPKKKQSTTKKRPHSRRKTRRAKKE